MHREWDKQMIIVMFGTHYSRVVASVIRIELVSLQRIDSCNTH